MRRYPALAWRARDRGALWLFGLVRNRVPGARLAAQLATGSGLIAPRLTLTRGQPVRVQLDHSGQVDVFDELFISRVYDLGGVGFVPEMVVDCGAYCGYFSAMATGAFPRSRFVCFEANPANRQMLESQLALLDVKVELRKEAVYVRDGTVGFSGEGMGGALEMRGESVGEIQVPCINFPRWLQAKHPASLVWKLDVEGAELEILPATLEVLPRMTACFLETHHPDATCVALLAPYRQAGFSVKQVRRRQVGDSGIVYIEWLLVRTG